MDELSKRFVKTVIPSVLSFTLSSLYCFADCFFVGNCVGDAGIAAINVSFCVIALFLAIGSGVGLGASVRFSVSCGQGDEKSGNEYLGVAFYLMLFSGFLIALPLILFPIPILRFLGAGETVAIVGKPYLMICSFGGILQILGTGAVPIVRNCVGAVQATVSMIAGCVSNIALDWLFVWIFDWGIKGAALATILGQAVALVFCCVYLQSANKLKIHASFARFWERAREIFATGLSPFGLMLVPNISIILLNKTALIYGGEQALGAYGVVMYFVYVALIVLQGIGDGSQPLVSFFYGKDDVHSVAKLKRLTVLSSLFLSVMFAILFVVLKSVAGVFMGASGDVCEIIEYSLPIFACSLPCLAVSRSIASCLYASEQNKSAYFISYSEPFFVFVGLLIFPKVLGLDGVWIANVFAQFVVAVCAVWIGRKASPRIERK